MKKRLQLIAFILLALASVGAASAEDYLEQGIKEFQAGKYSDALNHLNMALNSEFNNAKLHYYMGSCYMKLNKKESAVREFRIAYALEPTGKAGQYSKQALASMGADGGSSSSSSSSSSASGDVTTKSLQDQKALGRAIAEYALRRSNAGGGGGGMPPGFSPYN
jgi:tetratricopeptide (TPR) repeat protein